MSDPDGTRLPTRLGPPTRRSARRVALRGCGAATALLLGATGAASADLSFPLEGFEPDFEAPFACGQDWSASTRSGHSPSWYSVDFNRDDDFRAPVLMSAPGVVTDVVDVGDTSYGKYVVVDHGHGWTSLFAHLDAQWVVEGQWLDQGSVLGLLGTSGGSTGPHLHFEERLDRQDVHARFHGRDLDYDSEISSRNCGDQPITGDWDGDQRTDVGVFRPRPTGGRFRLRQPGGSRDIVRFGGTLDDPVTGDWDGDGKTDVGVWKRGHGTWLLRGAGGRTRSVTFGGRRDVPITGDWDGDGVTDLGVFRPSRGTVRLRRDGGQVNRVRFGGAASVPVTGDWDGDGRTDLASFDVRRGSWQVATGRGGRLRADDFGGVGSLPVSGDWNGDGTDSLGVWAPMAGAFHLQTGSTSATVRFGAKRRR